MSELPCAPASERNKHPILEQLAALLPENARVLEIGSGFGQHAVFFCTALPGLDWQPSERGPALADLELRITQQGPANLRQPLSLDVLSDPWPDGGFDVVYTANTTHIMPWRGVELMFDGASRSLNAGGQLIIYGPFNLHGQFTSSGNRTFDLDLRGQDPQMGLRDIADIDKLARQHHMEKISRIDMPANNMLLVYKRV